MAYKEFGATIAPANISETGFPITMGSHIGGGRTIDDKSNLKLWQLLGDGADLTEQKANAIGQIWYDRSDSKYYKLTGFTGDVPNWDEYLDTSNIEGTTNYITKFTNTNSIGDSLIYDDGTNIGIGTTTPSEKLEVDGNINLSGNEIKNVAIEVVTSLPTTDVVGRQVTYEGRSYIWDGSTWKCDSDYWEIGGRNLIRNFDAWNGLGGFTYDLQDKSINIVNTANYYNSAESNLLYLLDNTTYTLVVEVPNIVGDCRIELASRPDAQGDNKLVSTTLNQGTNKFTFDSGVLPAGFTHYTLTFYGISSSTPITVKIKNIKLEKGNKATDWTPAPEDKADESREINYISSSIQLTNDQTHLLSVVLNTYGGNIAKLFSDLEALGIKDKKEYPITGSSGTILVSTHNIINPSVVAFYKNGKPIELDYTIASNGDISWASSVSFLGSSGVKVVIIG